MLVSACKRISIEPRMTSLNFLRCGLRSDWSKGRTTSLRKSDRRPQRKKFSEVILGSIEIRLQADTNIGMRGQRAAIDIQCRIHIVACLHVHPDDGVFLCALNNGVQMLEAEAGREIQPKLRQFD